MRKDGPQEGLLARVNDERHDHKNADTRSWACEERGGPTTQPGGG